MMRIIKIYQIAFLVVLSFQIVSCSIGNEDPTKRITVIELTNDNCKLYLKHIVWGVTGDNSITYISQNEDITDTIQEPYFRVIDFFYKLDDNCILYVYKSDSLHRSKLLNIEMKLIDDGEINYSNYKKEGYDNVLYH